VKERRHAPAALATARFDLDDVGSEVTQELGTQRPGDPPAEIENPEIVER
jgi:hypothetical protein